MTTSIRRSFKHEKSAERLIIWFTILATIGMVAAHLVVALVHNLIPELHLDGWTITLGAIGLAAVFTFMFPRLSHILPEWLDGSARTHPVRATLFSLLALLTIVQIARLSTHKTDPNTSWWILTTNEFWSAHECGTAYFYAVELNDRGEENIYLADHYPILNRDVEPHTNFEDMRVEDAFQYPPQFLLLPKLLLSITHHYPTIRIIWFSLQFIGIAAVFLLIAHWVGGTAGRWMAMLTPLVMISPAALYAFQYTQFHFIAIALAIAGMYAFEKQHNVLGGALLAAAILGKIFPGFLLILLLAEKRWKPLAWTAVYGIGITIIALVILGTTPFTAFINYHLPRMQSFAAFNFINTWPEFRFELITDNISPYGQIVKLGEMGVPGMTQMIASGVNSFLTLILIGLVIISSHRLVSRVLRVQVWLAILGLASMMSPAAWGDYITLPAMWLLTVLAVEAGDNRKLAIVFGVCWVFFYFLLGLVPIGNYPAPIITYTLSTINFILLIGLMVWVMLWHPHPVPEMADKSSLNTY
jgi:alpha-1,2-mannosyltransferase